MTAILFTLWHGSLAGVPAELLTGLLLGYVAFAFDSVYAAITYHTVYNTALVLVNVYAAAAPVTAEEEALLAASTFEAVGGWPGVLALAFYTALLIWAMRGFLRVAEHRRRMRGIRAVPAGRGNAAGRGKAGAGRGRADHGRHLRAGHRCAALGRRGMNAVVLCVGRLKEPWQRAGVEEYLKRLSRYGKYSVEQVDDAPDSLGARALEKRGRGAFEAHSSRRPRGGAVRGGRGPDSPGLAQCLRRWAALGSRTVLVIGGSNGLSAAVLARADEKVSFSRLTFPHGLMRVILLEQLYRAERILAGEPYHK